MKEPSFYCENCGKPVALKANSCPSCGRAFEAVKCPECGFSGKAVAFADGCPSCGYLSSFASSVVDSGIVEVSMGDENASRRSAPEPPLSRKALPGWAYTLIAVGLIGILVLLLVIYLTLD